MSYGWIRNGAVAGALVAVLALLSVPAEAGQVECRIPFSFTVDRATLPPGRYTVSAQSPEGVLFLRGFSRGAFAVASPLASTTDTGPRLVFHKYGDQYVLRQVWMEGGSGNELPEPRRERELMEAARNGKGAVELEQVVLRAL